MATTIESIEEQWNPPASADILSDSWIAIADAKKAVKIWILDRGESWGHVTQNNKTDSNSTASSPPVPSICELRKKGLVYLVSHPVLHTIVLPLHTPILSTATQHGILLALWNVMLQSIGISNQRRFNSVVKYITGFQECHICQHGE